MAGIFSRLFNLGKAKVNKAVSKMEDQDPITMIESALSEARKQLSEFESAVRDSGAEKVRLEKEVSRLKSEVKKWGDNAETALEENKEDLAKKALERQADLETELNSTQAQYKSTKANFENMTQKIIEKKKYISNQESKMSSLKAKFKASQTSLKMKETMAKYEGNNSSFDQIERFEDKVEQLSNKVIAADEMEEMSKGEDLDSQFEELESKSSVNDKLAALKKKMNK